jgi:hypothetical protein
VFSLHLRAFYKSRTQTMEFLDPRREPTKCALDLAEARAINKPNMEWKQIDINSCDFIKIELMLPNLFVLLPSLTPLDRVLSMAGLRGDLSHFNTEKHSRAGGSFNFFFLCIFKSFCTEYFQSISFLLSLFHRIVISSPAYNIRSSIEDQTVDGELEIPFFRFNAADIAMGIFLFFLTLKLLEVIWSFSIEFQFFSCWIFIIQCRLQC